MVVTDICLMLVMLVIAVWLLVTDVWLMLVW